MSTKNKLTDLNDHLFMALERVNYDDLSEEELKREIARSKMITSIAQQVINNAKTVIQASKIMGESIPETIIPKKLCS